MNGAEREGAPAGTAPEALEEQMTAWRKPTKQRIRLLDGLRGFSLVSMIIYHAMYDLVVLFGVRAAWYFELPGYLWQQSICWVFILVSGASLHYGRHPVRRGLLVFGCGLLLTVVTALAMPEQAIYFGVLHFLGLAMVLAGFGQKLLRRVPAVLGLILSFAVFLFTKGVPRGFVGVGDVALLQLPAALYGTPFLFWLGFPGPAFTSADYFPLIPWLFLFLAGYFGWGLLMPRLKTGAPGRNPLEWMGRHSLLIYMLHQPVIYGVLMGLAAMGVF